LTATERDSMFAQAVADREGPGVGISTQISSTSGGRRVRADFHLDNDAYVLVGHVDADGIMRIVFPADPRDDGFVRGDKAYQTTEFFAGFTDEYRFRASDPSFFRTTAASRDSYDGGLGYVFVIASWRPMHFDRFATEDRWDTFELASEQYLRDPRPAIHELASLLAGDNREAYTVKFANYYTSVAFGSPYDARNAYGFGYCSGFNPLGFASSPFGLGFVGYRPFAHYGESFQYRGSNYYYNAAGDCYTSGYSGFGYGNGFRGYIVQGIPGVPSGRPRVFDLDQRRPRTPRPLDPPRMPAPKNGQDAGATLPGQRTTHFSPDYRRRGLITADDPGTRPVGRQPRIEARMPGEDHTRPTIQEMTGRRPQNSNDGWSGNGARSRARDDGSVRQGWTQQQPQQAQERQRHFDPGTSSGEHRGSQRPSSADGPRRAAPEREHSAPRSEAPPRMSAPPARSAPPRSGPPAASSSSSGSSTSKPPSE
jgi:hypothetical protein